MSHNEREAPETAVPFPYTYHLPLTEYLVKYRYSVGTQQCCVLISMTGNAANPHLCGQNQRFQDG